MEHISGHTVSQWNWCLASCPPSGGKPALGNLEKPQAGSSWRGFWAGGGPGVPLRGCSHRPQPCHPSKGGTPVGSSAHEGGIDCSVLPEGPSTSRLLLTLQKSIHPFLWGTGDCPASSPLHEGCLLQLTRGFSPGFHFAKRQKSLEDRGRH